MRWLMFTLVLLIGALFNGGSLLNFIAMGSGHIRPSILIVMMVFFAFHAHRQDAIRCVFAVGLVADLVSTTMGPYMIMYSIVGLALNGISRTINTKRFIYQSAVVFFAFLLTEFPAAWLEAWKMGQARTHLSSTVMETAIYTAVLAPLFWMFLSWVWKWMYPRPEDRLRLR
ncbi:MAG: rod shape-determining protein MreD [Planctomycetes bacterium]|nr:rod shape-determining protein MreD [Planctomycetota bacterium]